MTAYSHELTSVEFHCQGQSLYLKNEPLGGGIQH